MPLIFIAGFVVGVGIYKIVKEDVYVNFGG